MEPFKLYWPAKPYVITQAWGLKNALYEQFGFKRHNGVDFRLGADHGLYSPVYGTVVRVGNQPNGGGIFVGVMTDQVYFPDGKKCSALLDFLHCERILVSEGQRVHIGDKLAIADNTGLSTGPHSHLQARRVYWNGKVGGEMTYSLVDSNDANNSFDPAPYWGSVYAQDYWKLVRYYQQIVALLQKLV